MVTVYVSNMRTSFEEDVETVRVMTATDKIPMGMTLDEIKARKLAAVESIPKRYIVEGSVSDGQEISGDRVLAYSIEKGEQLTRSKFKTPKEAGLAFMIPENYVAVSIPIDKVKGVSDMVKIGDFVNVVATIKDKETITKTVLQKVRVLTIGAQVDREVKQEKSIAGTKQPEDEATSSKKTITLAVTQADAEKIVFSEEEGRVWLTLMPSQEAQPTATSGQTKESIFR